MYRTLRIIRIIFAATVAAAVAAATLNVCGAGDAIGEWLRNMQIIPALISASVGWTVVWLAVTLLFGRLYCSFICPLGTLIDCASVVSARLSRHPRPYRFAGAVTWVRFLSVVAFVEAGSLGFTLMVSVMDPAANFRRVVMLFGALSATGLVTGLIVLAVIAIVAAMRGGRVICNTVCPVGAILGSISRLSLMRIDINPDLCTHCGKCEQVCKSRCIRSTTSQVDTTRCVVCFNCTAVCPNNAITWRAGQHRLQWPLLQRILPAKPRATASLSSTESTTKTNETISRPTKENPHRGNA